MRIAEFGLRKEKNHNRPFGELQFNSREHAQNHKIRNMPTYAGDQRVGRANQNFTRPACPQLDWLFERVQTFLGTNQCWFMPLLCGNEPVGGVLWLAKETNNSMSGIADLVLVAQAWGMTLRTAQVREQQNILTESLAAANRELGALQQQLVRAKSLSGLGEMAAGAAHEMNNPLAVVCGRAQLLASKLSDPQLKQEATLIATQGDRLSQIITDMMEFAKPHAPKPVPLQIGPIAEEAVKLAAERAGTQSAPVRLESASNIPPAQGDAKQLRGAIVEVLLNAIQASRLAEQQNEKAGQGVSAGGEVLVQIRFDTLDQQIIIQITDRGIGMTEETMRHAFSPFFSVKAAGRQRGMGLAKALRWVENHGGTIRLDSALGAGTTAVILIPLAGPAALTSTKR